MKIERKDNAVFIDGEKVKYYHFRLPSENGIIPARGGCTVAYTGDKDNITAGGIAYCSDDDNFQYSYGRNKACGRLEQGLFHDREGDWEDNGEANNLPLFIRNWSTKELADVMETLGYAVQR